MYTVKLDGKEYILRCDLNVIERIEEKYGNLNDALKKQGTVECIKFLLAEMINEHYYYAGIPEQVTEKYVGARLTSAELETVMGTTLSCLLDCVCKKK